jgi:hypothetical protein
MVDISDMMAASDESLVRFAKWIGAKIPNPARTGPGAWKYKLACSIVRAMKRGGRKLKTDEA